MNNTFSQDVEFLKKHGATPVILSNGDAQIAITPRYQGRVMTSTMAGADGISCGWINYELIESGENRPHINAFGGEDRFWLGPEGGQYSVYFSKGAPFTFENWQVPELLDTMEWKRKEQSDAFACEARVTLEDWSGTKRDIDVEREIRLLDCAEIATLLEMPFDRNEVKVVGYTTSNTVRNCGATAWTRHNGALSVWILGMFKSSPRTMVVIPYRKDSSGPILKDDYFGKIPADRLKIDEKNSVIFFRADGGHRGKIGLNHYRALPFLGSYDAESNILTIVRYHFDPGAGDYVNAAWEKQSDPFDGDVVNAYNDGVSVPGQPQLGKFYELESSSQAAFLSPGESLTHEHSTMHFSGTRTALDQIARSVLGVSLADIEQEI